MPTSINVWATQNILCSSGLGVIYCICIESLHLLELEDCHCCGFLVTLGDCRHLDGFEIAAPSSTAWRMCGGSGGEDL